MSQLKLVSLNTWLAVAMGRLLACCGPWKIFGILCKIVRVEMILNMASFDFVCMYLSQANFNPMMTSPFATKKSK